MLRDKDFHRWVLNTATGKLSQDHIAEDFPTRVGSQWVYQVTRYDGFNPNDIMTATRTMTQTIVGIIGAVPYQYLKIHREESQEVPLVVKGNYAVTGTLRPAQSSDYFMPLETWHAKQRQAKKLAQMMALSCTHWW